MLSQSSPLRTGGATEAGGRTSPVELASRGARCCRCAARCDAMRGVERPRCGEMGLRRRKEFKLACADDAGKWASERSGRRNVGGRHVTGPRTHRALSQVTPPRSAERLGRERHCRRSAPQIGGAGGPTLGGGGRATAGGLNFGAFQLALSPSRLSQRVQHCSAERLPDDKRLSRVGCASRRHLPLPHSPPRRRSPIIFTCPHQGGITVGQPRPHPLLYPVATTHFSLVYKYTVKAVNVLVQCIIVQSCL